MKLYFQNTELDSIDLQQSYLPIYYNAWLYDNHDDPLMSLVLNLAKKTEHYLKSKLGKSISERISALLTAASASISLGTVSLSFSGDRAKKAIESKDILESVKTAEEIRELVRGVLNDVITEKAERLVIFIDELDRCRPTYAIEMLERIKHYFDDERIIFIVSVNKEQLVHTISKHYGYGFDSTGYLNKFFDLNAHMPVVGNYEILDSSNNVQFCLRRIVNGLGDYYKLTLRDGLIFKQRMSNVPKNVANDLKTQGVCLSLFIPLIVILDITNQQEKTKFINGSSDILQKLSKEIPAIYDTVCRFGKSSQDESERFTTGFSKIQAVYEYAFKGTEEDGAYSRWELDINSNIKSVCMKACSNLKL